MLDEKISSSFPKISGIFSCSDGEYDLYHSANQYYEQTNTTTHKQKTTNQKTPKASCVPILYSICWWKFLIWGPLLREGYYLNILYFEFVCTLADPGQSYLFPAKVIYVKSTFL